MQFSDYQDFRLAVQKLIEGEDVDQATFSVNVLDLMIGLGETKVYHGDVMGNEIIPGLRASTMVTPLAITPSSGVYTLPADLLELKELYFDARRPIEIVSIERLRRMGSLSSNGSGLYAAQNGEALEFWPASTTGIVYGSYYAKPEALEDVDWADATTCARYPSVYLYAAMAECMAFLGFDSRVAFYQSKFRAAALSANQSEAMRVYGGSPLRVRAR